MLTSAPAAQEPVTAGAAEQVESVYGKVTRRIIPLLFVSFGFAFLDRINVGYAQLQMKPALHFSDSQYGLGAGVYFLSTILFAVPGVMFIERIGARLGFLILMVCWGVVSAGNMFVATPEQFYVLRFVMGLFECAFFPGIVFYLTFWYPASRRARATSYIMLSIQAAGIFGGPMSGAVMSGLDGVAHLQGWQWLFLSEGFPVVVLGVLCFLLLSNRPSEARWLSAGERAVVKTAVQADRDVDRRPAEKALRKLGLVLADPNSYALSFLNFATICAAYTFNFWLPSIIRSLGVASVLQIGLWSFFPYLFASLGVLGVGWFSDRLRERRWTFTACAVGSAATLFLLPHVHASFAQSMAVLCVFGFAINAAITLFWTVLATYMPHDRASAGIAFVGGLGGVAGFLSPTILGFVKDLTGSLDNGFYLFGALLILAALVMAVLIPARAVKVAV